MIYAIDFDGTICEDKFPMIGNPKQEVIDFIFKIKAEGHKTILNTCRVGERLNEAVRFCNMIGIEFDAINENLTERIDLFGSDTRKISADFYVDDRNIKINELR